MKKIFSFFILSLVVVTLFAQEAKDAREVGLNNDKTRELQSLTSMQKFLIL